MEEAQVPTEPSWTQLFTVHARTALVAVGNDSICSSFSANHESEALLHLGAKQDMGISV